MKTDRINLLVSKKKYSDISKYFSLFKITLIIIAVILLIFSLIIGTLLFFQNRKIETLTKEKQSGIEILNSQKEDEVKLVKITNTLCVLPATTMKAKKN